MKTLQLSLVEHSTLEHALNHYWNFAHKELERKDLGDLEKVIYEDIKKFSGELLIKVENL